MLLLAVSNEEINMYLDPYEESRCCRCDCDQAVPVARAHTPERLEACLVEARFGVTDREAAAVELDRYFERRGDGWVVEVLIDGRPWPRALLWLSPPDRLHVETSSREAFEDIAPVIAAMPTTVKRRAKREHDVPRHDYAYGYRQPRLHRDDDARPGPGPAEAIDQLGEEHERHWLQRPHELLGGMTPEAAAKDNDQLLALYDLLELAQVRGRQRVGLPPDADLNRVRESLGIGRRW